MDALILAAGLGTRLRPLTDRIPKALVEVDGLPMLERVAHRLVDAGATRLVINTAHLGEQVAAYVDTREGFGVETHVSDEPGGPYETGGGLKHAEALLRPPFWMHNADILTTVDLQALYLAHRSGGAVATLAVVPARTERYLLFDDAGLVGYAGGGTERLMRPPAGSPRALDFCGVQVGGQRLLDTVRAVPEQKFSIMDVYLRLARDGATIAAYERADHDFLDIGTPERLEEAHAAVRDGSFA